MKKKYLLVPALAGLMLTGCAEYSYIETPDSNSPNHNKGDVEKTLNVNEMKKELRNEIEAIDVTLDLNTPFKFNFDLNIADTTYFENHFIIEEELHDSSKEDILTQHSEITINDSVIHEMSSENRDYKQELLKSKDGSLYQKYLISSEYKTTRNEGLNIDNKLVVTNDFTSKEKVTSSGEEVPKITNVAKKLYFLDEEGTNLDEFNNKFTYSWEKFSRLAFAVLQEPFVAIDDYDAASNLKVITNSELNEKTYIVSYELSQKAVTEDYIRSKISTTGTYTLKFKDNLIQELKIDAINNQKFSSKSFNKVVFKENYVFSEYEDNDYKLNLEGFENTTKYDDVTSRFITTVPPIKDYVPTDKVIEEPKLSLKHFNDELYTEKVNLTNGELKDLISKKASRNEVKLPKPFIISSIQQDEVNDYVYDEYGAKVSSKGTLVSKESNTYLNDTSVIFEYEENETKLAGEELNYGFVETSTTNSKSIKYKEFKNSDNKIRSSNETILSSTIVELDENDVLKDPLSKVIETSKATFVGDDITTVEFYEGHMNHNSTNLALRSFKILDEVPTSNYTLKTDVKLFKKETVEVISILYTYEAFDSRNRTSYVENYNYQMVFEGDDVLGVIKNVNLSSFDQGKLTHEEVKLDICNFSNYKESSLDNTFGDDFEITNKYINNLPDVKYELPFPAK